ncbi:MAG TPA: DUF1080 domain-containing protein [Bryobacteraceae bacterium]|jgi:hypothetical protein|nr:DUF1080 domain-containing protein [Bryobacteraceae bacterium]
MRRIAPCLAVAVAATVPFLSVSQTKSPFVGRWDFNLTAPQHGATWLGVTDKGGTLEVWYQPTGGNVYQVKDVKATAEHLTITLNGGRKGNPPVLEFDAPKGDTLDGVQKVGDRSMPLHGVRTPELNRPEPKAWSAPEPLFNGKDLTGWEPIGDVANSHWTVKDGMLFNATHGANLRTTRTFTDFKVHYEVNCPDDANSGFYLRGRYEVQIESEDLSKNPPERRIGAIYGRITPEPALPRTPGAWEAFDVMLVGRTVTVKQNGTTTIDHKIIDGITGGALDANEGEPGPFYIQGDHTGGLQFRNITVSVPK